MRRLYCRIFGHRWRSMTGPFVWAPIECDRCGFVVDTDAPVMVKAPRAT